MTTDQNIEFCYQSMKDCLNIDISFLDKETQQHIQLANKHMLSKFELWMAEDLKRLGLKKTN